MLSAPEILMGLALPSLKANVIALVLARKTRAASPGPPVVAVFSAGFLLGAPAGVQLSQTVLKLTRGGT